MVAKNRRVLEVVSGWEAVELVIKCMILGLWQLMKISMKNLWKGHRRKLDKNCSVELTVDTSVGTHCFIKIMGVKYHYVKMGPRTGQVVLVLNDAPQTGTMWGPNWTQMVQTLADNGFHIITLDLRGTGGSESGSRRDLSPPRVVEELSALLTALGVTENNPAVVLGFGIGGMLTWYLAHCHSRMISKLVVVDAPHPNLYWQYPPAAFCQNALHFIQWPSFPEQWLAESESRDGRWASSRPCDWTGPLNYVRGPQMGGRESVSYVCAGAAWWRIRGNHRIECPALLIGAPDAAAQLVTSATTCLSATIRMVQSPRGALCADRELVAIICGALIEKDKSMEEPRTLVGRMLGAGRILGAVAGRGRELTAKLVLPPVQ